MAILKLLYVAIFVPDLRPSLDVEFPKMVACLLYHNSLRAKTLLYILRKYPLRPYNL